MEPHKLGLDANRPINFGPANAGALSPTVAPQNFTDVGAHWVRINFVLGPWSSPDDTTVLEGHDWAGAFRAILDGLYGQGHEVYALVGHECVAIAGLDAAKLFRSPPAQQSAAEVADATRWIEQYAVNFGRIVDLFGDRVKVFESFNEPTANVFHPPAIVHPDWFARMLQAIYEKVRIEMGRTDVKLVSGPLQGLHDNQNFAEPYLRDTYEAGKRDLGWGQPGRPIPFDGVGYHMYLLNRLNPNWAAHEQLVRREYGEYIGAMMRAIQDNEGQNTQKRLFISEIGWRCLNYSQAWLDFQARNVQLALELTSADTSVEIAIWFCTLDFKDGAEPFFYGLFRQDDLSQAGRKPSFAAYHDTCARLFGMPQKVAPAYTNQNVLTAFSQTAAQVGKTFWDLYHPTGLNALRLDLHRGDRYAGPPIAELPNLSDRERALILEKLPGIQPQVATAQAAKAQPAPAQARGLDQAGMARAAAPVVVRGGDALRLGKGVWVVRTGDLRDVQDTGRHDARTGDLDVAQDGGRRDARTGDLRDTQKGGRHDAMTAEQHLAAMAADAGLGHVIVQVADGERPFPSSGHESVHRNALIGALRAAGVQVWGAHHVHGLRWSADAGRRRDYSPYRQADLALQLVGELHLDGLVVQAGADYKGQPGRAERLMDALRASMPELPIGLSAYAFPSLHPTFPWEAFLERASVNIPQVFWGRSDPAAALARSLGEHERHAHAKPVVPTGAAENRTGGPVPAPEAIAAFLDAAMYRFGLPGASVFRWETTLGTGAWRAVAEFKWE